MIIERVDWTGERGNPEYRPGIVYIFEASTGRLTQRLQLPPEGKLLLFDHYPDQLFYHVEEGPAIQVELNDVMDDSELIDDLMHFIDEADQQGWLFDAAFISDLRQMMQQVQDYLLSDELVPAASELSRFLELIEAVNSGEGPPGAGLTDDGYAQLFFIAIHLLERLPEPLK